MAKFEPILSTVSLCINLFSIFVLVFGVLLCAKNFILAYCTGKPKAAAQLLLLQAKIELGRFVLLGLEILIVADIIESIAKPTAADILRLASIVAIRTVISYFLNKEIKETRTDVKEDLEHPDDIA